MIHGSKGRCPTIRRSPNIVGFLTPEKLAPGLRSLAARAPGAVAAGEMTTD